MNSHEWKKNTKMVMFNAENPFLFIKCVINGYLIFRSVSVFQNNHFYVLLYRQSISFALIFKFSSHFFSFSMFKLHESWFLRTVKKESIIECISVCWKGKLSWRLAKIENREKAIEIERGTLNQNENWDFFRTKQKEMGKKLK